MWSDLRISELRIISESQSQSQSQSQISDLRSCHLVISSDLSISDLRSLPKYNSWSHRHDNMFSAFGFQHSDSALFIIEKVDEE